MLNMTVGNANKTTMRYHLTSARIAVIQKSTTNLMARMWRKGNLCALLVGLKVQPLWKTIRRSLKNLKIALPYTLQFYFYIFTWIKQNPIFKKIMWSRVCRSILYNSQETYMFIDRWMEKYVMFYLSVHLIIYGILRNSKKWNETSSQDGGVGRHTVPPHTAKRTTTI